MTLPRQDRVLNTLLVLSLLTTTVAVTPELRDVFLQPLEEADNPSIYDNMSTDSGVLPTRATNISAPDKVVHVYIEKVYGAEYWSAYALLSPGIQTAIPFDDWRSGIMKSRTRLVESTGRSYSVSDVIAGEHRDDTAFVDITILADSEQITTEVRARHAEGGWRVDEAFNPYILTGDS